MGQRRFLRRSSAPWPCHGFEHGAIGFDVNAQNLLIWLCTQAAWLTLQSSAATAADQASNSPSPLPNDAVSECLSGTQNPAHFNIQMSLAIIKELHESPEASGHGVRMCCAAGLVEAWANGAAWTQIMQDCSLDDGDVARLFSRTADILRQAAHCPGLDPELRKSARRAMRDLDRPPISDLVT